MPDRDSIWPLFCLGLRVRELRKAQGRTLWDLGSAAGMSESMLSRFESGKSGLRWSRLDKLAKALGCEIEVTLKEKGK